MGFRDSFIRENLTEKDLIKLVKYGWNNRTGKPAGGHGPNVDPAGKNNFKRILGHKNAGVDVFKAVLYLKGNKLADYEIKNLAQAKLEEAEAKAREKTKEQEKGREHEDISSEKSNVSAQVPVSKTVSGGHAFARGSQKLPLKHGVFFGISPYIVMQVLQFIQSRQMQFSAQFSHMEKKIQGSTSLKSERVEELEEGALESKIVESSQRVIKGVENESMVEGLVVPKNYPHILESEFLPQSTSRIPFTVSPELLFGLRETPKDIFFSKVRAPLAIKAQQQASVADDSRVVEVPAETPTDVVALQTKVAEKAAPVDAKEVVEEKPVPVATGVAEVSEEVVVVDRASKTAEVEDLAVKRISVPATIVAAIINSPSAFKSNWLSKSILGQSRFAMSLNVIVSPELLFGLRQPPKNIFSSKVRAPLAIQAQQQDSAANDRVVEVPSETPTDVVALSSKVTEEMSASVDSKIAEGPAIRKMRLKAEGKLTAEMDQELTTKMFQEPPVNEGELLARIDGVMNFAANPSSTIPAAAAFVNPTIGSSERAVQIVHRQAVARGASNATRDRTMFF